MISRESSRSNQGLLYSLHLDTPLVLGLVLLCAAGLITLYSASGQDMDLIIRQGLRILAGFTLMVVLAQIPYQNVQYWTPAIYVAGIALLIGVLFAGDIGKGAQRWLDLGLFRFQPSEIMKLTVPMAIAWYLAELSLPPRFRNLLVPIMILLLPTLLIARQPDLGTALLVGFTGIMTLLLAGVRWRLVWATILLMAAGAPMLWFVLHDYQRSRILTLFNPERDPLGAGYHIIQSKIAIGSGGLYGKGWLNGTQSHLEFLPERTTDFIFAVYSEEFGLVGILLLLGMYLFIIGRGLYLSSQAQTTYGRLLGGSLVLTFFLHMFINIGMVIGLLPVVGLPLPLFSYGGTSMVIILAGFGILMSIHTHRKMLSPY
jgi:rod shape determining protein RodA